MEKAFRIDGIDCANCAAKIERALSKLSNVEKVNINFMTGKMLLAADRAGFRRGLCKRGENNKEIRAVRQPSDASEKGLIMRKRRIKFARICVSAALFAVAMVFEHAFKAKWAEIAAVALFSVSYLIVGYDILWRALTNILHGRVFDENFLMTVATVGAVALGELGEARGG